jgi:hypothetical protein
VSNPNRSATALHRSARHVGHRGAVGAHVCIASAHCTYHTADPARHGSPGRSMLTSVVYPPAEPPNTAALPGGAMVRCFQFWAVLGGLLR